MALTLSNFTFSGESDPTVPSEVKSITPTQIGNWDTAYGRSPTTLTFNGTTLTLTRQGFSNIPVDLSSLQSDGWDIQINGGALDSILPGENVNFVDGSNVSISYDAVNNAVTIGATDTQLTEEQVQDFAWNVLTGTQTLVDVTYDDLNNNVSFIVDDDLSKYDNSISGFLSTETDPVFTASPAGGITTTQITNWETGYDRSPTSLSLTTNTLTLARQGVVDLTVNLSSLSDGGDAATLDGIDSSQFLRSDINDTATGIISFTGAVYFANQMRHLGDSDTYMEFHALDQWRVVTGAGERFEVNSTAVTSSVELRCTADIVAFFSDERLKTKTGKLDNALNKINSLEAFTYTSNELAKKYGYTDEKQRVGVSAQQVQKVLPEAVTRAPFDNDQDEDGNEFSKSGEEYLAVDYGKLVPLLITGMQEHRKITNNQEERIVELESMVEKLTENT